MFVLMFEFIYYVSVIWQVKLDFDGGLSYWVKNEAKLADTNSCVINF